ncbi:MAG: AI-2E family transporter [Deltaproteobacteria bacterium]|nr:MAG: AI-2E family transporter [Deltaproteobacteria bacterium]
MDNRWMTAAAAMILAIGAFFVLVWGKSILLPLAVAVMLWYLLNALSDLISAYGSKVVKLPRWVYTLLAMVISLGATSIIFDALTTSLSSVTEAAPLYQTNFTKLAEKGAAFFGLEATPTIRQIASSLDIKSLVGSLAGMVTTLAGNIGIIIVYLLFILIEERTFEKKLTALFKSEEDRGRVIGVIEGIQSRIRTYVFIKTALSGLTGVLSYAILLMVGVDYALFWAFLIFLLNYIPTIGSMVGVLLPTLLTLVQFSSPGPFFVVLASLGTVQFLIGNILDPKLMGGTLNLSALVVLFSLALWGKLWGVVGMFLCVPFTVMAMIIFAEFPRTRPIAVLLSGDGDPGPTGEEAQ